MPKSRSRRKPKSQNKATKQTVASKAASQPKVEFLADKKQVLHVGCGQSGKESLPKIFQSDDWQEIRFDIDEAVKPDLIGDIRDMRSVPSESVDAVFSSHNLEHVYPHEVPSVMKEFFRVVKPGGMAMITLPDIQAVAFAVAAGKLEDPLYESPSGPITPLEIMYGHIASLQRGKYYMAHKTAFTGHTLARKMLGAGFHNVQVTKDITAYNLWARGVKPGGDVKKAEHQANVKGQYPYAVVPVTTRGEVKLDDLDAEPKRWESLGLQEKMSDKADSSKSKTQSKEVSEALETADESAADDQPSLF